MNNSHLEEMAQQLIDEYTARAKRNSHVQCGSCSRLPLRCVGLERDLTDEQWYEDCEEQAALCQRLIEEGTT